MPLVGKPKVSELRRLRPVLAILIIALGLSLVASSGYAQSEVQTAGTEVQTRLAIGGGLLMAWGGAWPLARLSAARGRWGADLDLWGQGLRRFFLMPALTVDFIFRPNRLHAGFAPVVLVEEGRPQLLEFLLIKGGIAAPLGDLGLEAFTETIFPLH
jgi:hypothetical protein